MIEGITVLDELSAKYGDGFYMLYETKIENSYNQFDAAFKKLYPRIAIAYSFKTCNANPLLMKLKKLGAMAEITSEYEY